MQCALVELFVSATGLNTVYTGSQANCTVLYDDLCLWYIAVCLHVVVVMRWLVIVVYTLSSGV